jgi:acyl-ACP thioesterase
VEQAESKHGQKVNSRHLLAANQRQRHMKFEIPEIKKKVHEMIIPIRWGDMDAMGHVNNTVYFRYLETVRIDYFNRLAVNPTHKAKGRLS